MSRAIRFGHLLTELRNSDVDVFERVWHRKLKLYDKLAKMEAKERKEKEGDMS